MVTIPIAPICCRWEAYCAITISTCTFLTSTDPRPRSVFPNLGPRQASDLNAAIETVTRQPDMNPNRVGVFGMSVGGYAALVAAESNPKVRALVVDTTYSDPGADV